MITDRLKEAREMCGMSVRQAARFSGQQITSQRIEELESGLKNPTERELAILAETYEVRQEWLRGEVILQVSALAVNARALDGLAPNDVAKLIRQLQAHRQS